MLYVVQRRKLKAQFCVTFFMAGYVTQENSAKQVKGLTEMPGVLISG